MRQGRFAGVDPGGGGSGSPPSHARLLAPLAAAALLGLAATAGADAIGGALLGAAVAGAGAILLLILLRTASGRLAATASAAPGGGSDRGQAFLALAEDHGQSWFWETNADGLLTYITPHAAGALSSDGRGLVGQAFADLPLVPLQGDVAGEGRAVAFNLQSRFPFRHVPVGISNGEERWLLSGSPRFDALGRFLGFHGFGAPLTPERREAAEAQRAAKVDSLTGLPNRAGMEALLGEALTNAERRRQGCALFLIDLDRFKQVNDTLGHPVGDVLLSQVAERMAAALGDEGQCGRLGGDEFEAVFPGIGEEGRLAAIAERLIDSLSAPYLIHGHKVVIGASLGVAIARAGKTYAQALVKEADLALYAAKRAGRGTFRFFEPAMHAEETERKILEADLTSAAAKGQLQLLYQPIISTSTERLVGFEALLRWWHPTRGLLSPADFLPIAASAGQMPMLGEWILRTACDEASAWPEHLRLAINIAPEQLAPGLLPVLANALAASGLDAARVELELRDEVLAADDPARAEVLQALHGLGVTFAADDFGMAGADLACLRAVPLARLKLHPTLLRAGLSPKGRGRTLLVALMRLAETLDVEVTAECAETLDDLQLARTLGCHAVQGYLFGRPVSPEEARDLAAAAAPLDPQEAARQRPPRHSLIRTGTLHSGADLWPVRMRNISAGGAMVECDRALAAGVPVELDLAEGLRLRATVRWSHDGRLGLQFSQAFDLARLGRAKREGAEAGMMPDYLRAAPVAETPRLAIRDLRR